ncbi:MAG: sulfotransferase [Anaerolineae bacterium]|nr:sulfotransferase [Anaerolineae bacterium]
MNNSPIFLTGSDRSGTSLMFALLASHPNISMVRRTNMWRWFYKKYGDLGERANFERCLTTLLRYQRLEHLKPDPERIRHEFWQGSPPTYGRLFALFHKHYAELNGRTRWGDKSLHTEHYADQIFAEFPDAKMIHMIRDPRDRYASILKRYDDIDRGMASTTGRWLLSARMAKRNLKKYPEKYRVICYETLARQPEEMLQQVCDFIGEAYTPIMLSMQGAPEHQAGNSSFDKFEPGVISTRSIGRFRKVLSRQQISFIQTCARRHLVAFNYRLDPIQLVTSEKLRFYLADLPINMVRLAGWSIMEKVTIRRGRSVPDHRLTDKQQPKNQTETVANLSSG